VKFCELITLHAVMQQTSCSCIAVVHVCRVDCTKQQSVLWCSVTLHLYIKVAFTTGASTSRRYISGVLYTVATNAETLLTVAQCGKEYVWKFKQSCVRYYAATHYVFCDCTICSLL